jgi:GT2 family glycosyltransferase
VSGPAATIVVVCRDRWSQAPATLDLLLARTDPRHRVVVVDAGAPPRISAAFDRLAAGGRIGVVRRSRALGSNEARNAGADGVRTDWIAFVENDVVPSDGWLDALLEVGEARDAASVFPVYLEPNPSGDRVHGTGADLEVHEDATRFVREHQHLIGRRWCDVASELRVVERVQSEPHLVVMRRDLLDTLGGLDEELVGWFEHTDLALHHRRLGASSWLAPHVTCRYLAPPPVAVGDVAGFLLRWGRGFFDRSLTHLCSTWHLDPRDREWDVHETYRASVRRSVPTRWSRVNGVLESAAVPVERVLVRRWDARE